jgi:transcription-repair coupling factor (superfamily II helicase)
MRHRELVDRLRHTGAYREVLAGLPGRGAVLRAGGLPGASPAVLLAALGVDRPAGVSLVVAPSPDAADEAAADLRLLIEESRVLVYPQREALPYEEGEPHVEIGGQRVEAVEALLSGRASVLVTTARGMQELSPAVGGAEELRLELRTGMVLRPADLSERLEQMGFIRSSTVEEVGQYALRGGILDVFGFGSPEPVRVEFWGDEIESLRHFDILTQLSVREVEALHLLPVDLRAPVSARAGEEGERRSLLDYLPADALLIRLPEVDLEEEWRRSWEEVVRLHASESRRGRALEQPDALFLPATEVARRAAGHPLLLLEREEAGPGGAVLPFDPPEPIDRDMQRLGAILRSAAERGDETLILCDNEGQVERLQELLEELRLPTTVTLDVGSLTGGFVLRGAGRTVRVLTDHEIFRRRRRLRRRRRFRGGAAIESFAALRPGEYVVHMDHGIGVFRGMETVRVGGEEFETLLIEYANGELLRLPVHRVDLIERWVSDADDGPPPKVHRIGGREWTRTRKRTQEAIESMAGELLELYAERAEARGHAFSPDTHWQREMESSFLFDDTRDQRQATEDVKGDMESPRPMDRLICGDVGYGKTEIAIRAAFKAVQDGKQVAVLVPTTILAEQHLQTFSERLAGFPVRIEALSRFRSAKEQGEALARLQRGELDIIIGTHRLLSPDVAFHDLGLIVVDEEQRFGVKHKERLKQLKASVDVLTLTATPIPRTLHLSLLGLRDMTLIQTPPRDRQPIITHVLPWSDAILGDALQRELDRGGQIFFVHNRVETIDTIAARVQRLAPGVRIGVAHGQMRERELEEVMSGFVAGEILILVATSIIESGLDVSRANTLIVNRADQFGLAQLYQIRGRVGRSHHRAYCYLVLPEDVSDEVEKRLRVLEHYTELGSGYGVALKDLELRGAGNILGSAQSGFVHAVGFETYLRLLEQTIRRLKGDAKEPAQRFTEVSVDGAALLPDEYVADEAQKLQFYRRLSRVETLPEIESVRRELRDRYGPLPREAETLLATAALRIIGGRLGLERLLVRPWDARLNFRAGVFPRMTALQKTLTEWQFEVELKRPSPLSLELRRSGPEPIERQLVAALDALAADRSAAA